MKLFNYNKLNCIWVSVFTATIVSFHVFAINSKIVKHSDADELSKGTTENTIIDSRGTIRLGRAATVLIEDFDNVWSINDIVQIENDIYLGTSPNGGIYKYSGGKLQKIYPISDEQRAEPAEDVNDPNTGKIVKRSETIENQHIFAIAADSRDRLLAAVSGKECRLMRFDGEQMETVFEPNDARYIFDIAVVDKSIFVATGPSGIVYRIDADGAVKVYQTKEKNVLSLAAGEKGTLYAGTDTRGLVYKIDTNTGQLTVVYDSEQPEITALVYEQGKLYAAGTRAEIKEVEANFAASQPAGRVETITEETNAETKTNEDIKLKIPNTPQQDDKKKEKKSAARPAKPEEASFIYEIDDNGFINKPFSTNAVFFDMAAAGGELFVAVGPKAKVYSVKPAKEISEMFFEDKQSSQVTSIEPAAGKLYLGLANPAKLVLCEKALAQKGTYQSSLIDASQPAQWGKIQLNADITAGTKLLVSTRTGNVGDVNDGSFSQWTQPVEVKDAVDINSPTGRFCQYKLIFETNEPLATAIVRAAAVSFTVPNLAPKIESVTIEKADEKEKKPGVMKITCKASDDNEDTLIYDIDFRRLDRTGWIKLAENIEEDNYQWDTRTVEDGRYEVRVRASDIRDNSPATAKTAVRISDPFVVDNTGPQLLAHSEQVEKAEVVISMIVSDQFSAVKKVDYTIDSNENWKGAIADDLVFDTTTENVTIRIEGLKKGEHVIAVRMTDAAENVTYTTLDAKI